MINKKLTILFADKDQIFHNEISVLLQDMQDEWEAKFAYSGKEAFEIMKKAPIDFIISDIDIPEIDGIQLLTQTKKLYPKIICILMSEINHENTDKIVDSFLKKPLSLDKLKKIIINPVDFLDKNKIRQFILKMDRLPTLPNLYLQLQELMKTDDFSFNEIAKIIEQDVSMTAKILQYVNSSYFGLRYRIYDILHAVTYLGIETLKSIILTLSIFCEFTNEEMIQFSINDLYNHSLNVSCLVSNIILSATKEDTIAEESAISGMLHDIGQLIFIKNKPDVYKEIYHIHKNDGIPLFALENGYFGVNHAEVGSFLTEVWGFSQNLIDAVNNHHNPHKALKPPLNSSSSVYIANILEHDHTSMEVIDESDKIQNYLRSINQIDNLSIWCTLASKIKENASKSIVNVD
ncbi:HDOD domain-containing protein [Candidatus Poribacteria bacterium]|nr:HDOD domain-containing protein [Candidatus Poribacteria bacterium]